jgi:hypothetical protein
MEFLGDRGAADDLAALDDDDLQSLRGEIAGADEAVVAGADDRESSMGSDTVDH